MSTIANINTTTKNSFQLKKNGLALFLCVLPILIFYGFNHANVPLKFSLVLGVLTFPYILEPGKQSGGYRYAVLALIVSICLLFFRSSSLFYFAAVFILFYVLDNWWGRINALPLILAMAISPIISTMVYIWSFPIRLKLSDLAADALQLVGMNIEAQGNLLLMNGNTFSVDPACIGLKMIITSLVLGLVILAFFEKKHQFRLSIWKAGFLLSTILIGAIVANFIRLLTLIIFHILPENPMHDVVGLLSLGIYVLLPFYFFNAFVFRHRASKKPIEEQLFEPPFTVAGISKLVLSILLLLLVFNGRQFLNLPGTQTQAATINLAGFDRSNTNNGILKFQNDQALVYIKAPVRFFQGSHDPRICWQGSGYVFSSIQLENIAGQEYYTAVLKQGEEELHTAWWYQSEEKRLVLEWNWRWQNLMQGEQFYLVNVTSTTKQQLNQQVQLNINGL